MAKLVKPLSDKALKAFLPQEKRYTVFDGKGLYIEVMTTGAKIWRFVFKFDGKKRRISLGRYPDVSLALARQIAQEKRALLAQGIDPIEYEKQKRQEKAQDLTVFELATLWLKKREIRKAVKPDTLKKDKRRLEMHLFPVFGDWRISAMTCKKVAQVFLDRPQTNVLYKVNNALVQMFEFAEIEEIIQRSQLKNLHKFFKYEEARHNPTIDPEELPRLFRVIHFSDKITRISSLLLEWQMLTMLRPVEAVGVLWSDVDFELKKLHIPGERMKMKKPHDVPLSKQALRVLEEVKKYQFHSDFIFPTQVFPYKKSMSSQTVNNALKRLGFKDQLVAHGLRSIASTYLHDLDRFSAQAIELCLSHDNRSKTQRSYDHSKKWGQRVKIMQEWGDFVEECKIKALKA